MTPPVGEGTARPKESTGENLDGTNAKLKSEDEAGPRQLHATHWLAQTPEKLGARMLKIYFRVMTLCHNKNEYYCPSTRLECHLEVSQLFPYVPWRDQVARWLSKRDDESRIQGAPCHRANVGTSSRFDIPQHPDGRSGIHLGSAVALGVDVRAERWSVLQPVDQEVVDARHPRRCVLQPFDDGLARLVARHQ